MRSQSTTSSQSTRMGKPGHLSESAKPSNAAPRVTWNALPVGVKLAKAALAGSPKYFARIREYRYCHEMWLMGFPAMAGQKAPEIGVGNGTDAVEVNRTGASYHGVDITRSQLDLTRRNLQLNVYEASLTEGDLTVVNVTGAPFDVAYSLGGGTISRTSKLSCALPRVTPALRPVDRAFYSRNRFFNAWLVITWVLFGWVWSLDARRSHLAERSPLEQPVTIRIRSRRSVEKELHASGLRVVSYTMCRFVKGYLPIIGRYLDSDGVMFNALGRVLGWYHIFTCERSA